MNKFYVILCTMCLLLLTWLLFLSLEVIWGAWMGNSFWYRVQSVCFCLL